MILPPPVLERHHKIVVVRDDLVPGGTKRRYLYKLLTQSPEMVEWVYASPRVGYAQLALAYACRDLGLKATVVLPKGQHTPITEQAIEQGATIIEVPMGFLSHIQSVAKKYAAERPLCGLLPFGLDHPVVIDEIAKVAAGIDYTPAEVWTCVSSGCLSRGLQKAWPHAKVYGVCVGHETDERERGRAELFRSAYKFAQRCKPAEKPPFPSSDFYDSKAWSFVMRHASDGALFWNVGA